MKNSLNRKGLKPVRNAGQYVFVRGDFPDMSASETCVGSIRETEGLSVIIHRHEADKRGLEYDFVAAWITLGIKSELDEVGLTARFSEALAKAHIPCNVVAGLRHDHLFVPENRADETINILSSL